MIDQGSMSQRWQRKPVSDESARLYTTAVTIAALSTAGGSSVNRTGKCMDLHAVCGVCGGFTQCSVLR